MSRIDLKRRAEIGAERRKRRKAAFIDTAMALIAEAGSLHALTPEALMKRAGASRSTFYNYFDGIDDVLEHVAAHVMNDLNHSILADYGHVESGPVRLAYSISQFFNKAEKDPGWGLCLSKLILEAGRISAQSREYFAIDIEYGRADGTFTVTDNEVARNLVGGISAMGLASIHRGAFDADRKRQTLISMLLALGTPLATATAAVEKAETLGR